MATTPDAPPPPVVVTDGFYRNEHGELCLGNPPPCRYEALPVRLPLSAVHRSTGVGLLADEATKYDLVVGESTIGVMMHHTQDLEQGSSEVCNESCVVRIHSTALRAAELSIGQLREDIPVTAPIVTLKISVVVQPPVSDPDNLSSINVYLFTLASIPGVLFPGPELGRVKAALERWGRYAGFVPVTPDLALWMLFFYPPTERRNSQRNRSSISRRSTVPQTVGEETAIVESFFGDGVDSVDSNVRVKVKARPKSKRALRAVSSDGSTYSPEADRDVGSGPKKRKRVVKKSADHAAVKKARRSKTTDLAALAIEPAVAIIVDSAAAEPIMPLPLESGKEAPIRSDSVAVSLPTPEVELRSEQMVAPG